VGRGVFRSGGEVLPSIRTQIFNKEKKRKRKEGGNDISGKSFLQKAALSWGSSLRKKGAKQIEVAEKPKLQF